MAASAMERDLEAREVALALLKQISDQADLRVVMSEVTRLMQQWSGCEAVGIRLKDGEDFPYFETRGFPPVFVEMENYLCDRDRDGAVVCDDRGSPVLSCMCGNVIQGRFDPALPFFTEGGSFWTNSTSALLAATTEAERQARTRNRCNGEGYESVALVPISSGREPMGLLQFNDPRAGLFTEADIRLYERLAEALAVGLSQHLMAQALDESEARLKMALDGAAAQCFEIRFGETSAEMSAAWLAGLGYAPTDVPKTMDGLCALVHSDDLAILEARLADHLEDRAPLVDVECRVRQRGGDFVWVLFRGKIVERLRDGRPKRLVGISFDVTARKRSEERQERNRFYLAKAQEIGSIGTWELDVPADALRWTDENYRIFDVPPGTPLTYSLFLSRVHPDDRDYVDLAWRSAVAGGSYDIEHRLLINGRVKWVREKAHFSRNEAGETTVAIGVTQDITERKQAEHERERLRNELLQAHKMESVGRLAGGVAHDFNNMLGVILGHAELGLDQLLPSDPLYANLVEIQKAAERSADLTKQLLAFARKQAAMPKVLNLGEAVAGTLSMLQRLIGEEIALSWSHEPGLWLVRMDPTQLVQVLANLCVNARDAIAGVGAICIGAENVVIGSRKVPRLPELPDGDYVRLSITDNGCGMTEATRARLFEPFYTTKSLGAGTGLGLATVYGVVTQNHGAITVESTLGSGTAFSIYLPRCVSPEPAADVGPEAVVARGHQETILLVEDEPSLLHLAREMLESIGYAVVAAVSPAEALRLAGEHREPISLLLTDVVMPEMNGRELAAKVTTVHPETKTLFMSGYTANVIADRGVLAPTVAFVQKPFRKQDLAEKIRGILGA